VVGLEALSSLTGTGQEHVFPDQQNFFTISVDGAARLSGVRATDAGEQNSHDGFAVQRTQGASLGTKRAATWHE
jgi:hypothetical protein